MMILGVRNPPSVKRRLCAGCLFTLPGSQKGGVQRRFKRRADDTVFFEGPALDCDLKQFVPLEVIIANSPAHICT